MVFSLLFLIVMLLAVASLVATIWAAIEIGTKPFVNDKDKVLWLIIVLMLGIIGPIIYYTQRKTLLAEFAEPGYDDNDVLDLNAPRPEPRERGSSSVDDEYLV